MELRDEHLFSEVGDPSMAAEMAKVYGSAPVWVGGHRPKTSEPSLEKYCGSDNYNIYLDFIEHDAEHDGRVLEIGCAGGPQTMLLARYFSEVVGIDSAPEKLEFARKYNQADNIKYVQGRFPCGAVEGLFDYIFCVSVVYQNGESYEPAKEGGVIKSALSMLKPGGKLFVYNPETEKEYWDSSGLKCTCWVSDRKMGYNDRWVVTNHEQPTLTPPPTLDALLLLTSGGVAPAMVLPHA